MRYVSWILRIILFVLLLGFAVKNDQRVELRYFLGYEWQVSLVVVLLCFFVVGIVLGMLAMLGMLLRQRRELAAVRRDLQLKNKLAAIESGRTPAQSH